MTPETISLKVGYKSTKITFHLRVVSLKEENLYTQRFIDLIGKDNREEREYQIIVDALSTWAAAMPTIEEDGKELPLMTDKTAMEATAEYFKERTNEKERIVNAAMVSFRNQMTPSVDFL